MDDKFKNLSFADFITVDYAQMNDELIAYRRKRLKNGAMHEETDEEESLAKTSQRIREMSKRMVQKRSKSNMNENSDGGTKGK